MLQIRQEQMDAFQAEIARSFEDEMLAHLAEFSPPLFRATGEEQIRATIRLGIKRAEGYGFTLRGPVRLYLELMLLFGSSFDSDPQYPWANQILTEPDATEQMQRAEILCDMTLDYQAQVAGEDDVHTVAALQQIAAGVRHPIQPPLAADAFRSWMVQKIAEIYPQKAAYIGDAGLAMLIDEGIAGGKEYGLTLGRPIGLIIVLMLAFGHGCLADPLYPWIGRTLASGGRMAPAAKAERLERKALIWLDHVLSGMYGGQE